MLEVDPKDTSRARAFELWMKTPNPMVTFFKTIDVTRLVRISRKKGYKFNMLLDWRVGKAASSVKEFFRCELPISFQFHHAQMDGAHAGLFLARLQEVINQL